MRIKKIYIRKKTTSEWKDKKDILSRKQQQKKISKDKEVERKAKATETEKSKENLLNIVFVYLFVS